MWTEQQPYFNKMTIILVLHNFGGFSKKKPSMENPHFPKMDGKPNMNRWRTEGSCEMNVVKPP